MIKGPLTARLRHLNPLYGAMLVLLLFKFTGAYLLLSEKFIGDYKYLRSKPPSTLIDMKENLLLTVLMLNIIDEERQCQIEK